MCGEAERYSAITIAKPKSLSVHSDIDLTINHKSQDRSDEIAILFFRVSEFRDLLVQHTSSNSETLTVAE